MKYSRSLLSSSTTEPGPKSLQPHSQPRGFLLAVGTALALAAGTVHAATLSDPPAQVGAGDFIDPPGQEDVDSGQNYGTAQSGIESEPSLRVLQDFSGITVGTNVITFTDPGLPAIRMTPGGSAHATAGGEASGKSMSSPGPAVTLTNATQNSAMTFTLEFGTWDGTQFTPNRVVEAAAFVLTDLSSVVTASAVFRDASNAVIFDTGAISGQSSTDGAGNHLDAFVGYHAKNAGKNSIRSITITRQVGTTTFIPPGGTSGLDDLAFVVEAQAPPQPLPEATSDWNLAPNRIWAGDRYWANRLQDWRIAGGRLECVVANKDKPMRTVHLLTRRAHGLPGDFTMRVRTGSLSGASLSSSTFSGFLIGAAAGMDYRAAALVHHNPGTAGGLLAGMNGQGRAEIRDNAVSTYPLLANGTTPAEFPPDATIEFDCTRQGGTYQLTVRVKDTATGALRSEATLGGVSPSRIPGSLAVVSHPGSTNWNARFWFRNWTTSGSKLEENPDRTLGPIVLAMHTLSGGILKMTAQLAAVSSQDVSQLTLERWRNGVWETAASAPVDFPSRTATFRVPGWDAAQDTPYRVRCDLSRTDGSTATQYWNGTIRHDPVEKNEIVVAGLTCMIHVTGGFNGVDKGSETTWTGDRISFPHADFAANLAKHDPDVLLFTGDQIYEGSSPTQVDRSSPANSELDYLYKWYLFCWSVADLARDRPATCMPDDHDVFQGNLWGEGGKSTSSDSQGGFIMPPSFVNMVQRTQTSHLPDPYDPTPVAQGITVYYTTMTYGRIGFAIFEDRKWKTGPDNPPPTSQLELLGGRQTAFLEAWTKDWKGHDMKLAVSQTQLTQGTTHSGPNLAHKGMDTDANGWPPARRDEAVRLLRKGFAPHVNGDQHLGMVVQHGVDAHGDSNYSFCVPAISNAWPRVWDPSNPNDGPTSTFAPVAGDYTDKFGNLIRVIAAGNPAHYYNGFSTGVSPAEIHDRGPGYGILRFDKTARTIRFEAWPRFADPGDASTWRALGPGNPPVNGMYPGWPITIRQIDNYGRTPVAYLPVVVENAVNNPVIEVIDESTGGTVYALRIEGHLFRPHVFATGSYTVEISEPDTGYARTLTGQSAVPFTGHVIRSFDAGALNIIRGTATSLQWDVTGSDTLSLTPSPGAVNDRTINGIGSITVTPDSDTEYVLASTGPDGTKEARLTVRVFDDLATWRARHFTAEELADPSKEATLWGHDADPDHDGLVNFFEFALAADPLADSADRLPQASLAAVTVDDQTLHFFEVLFHDLLNVGGVRYEVEYSSDLQVWKKGDLSTFEEFSRSRPSGETDVVEIRDTTPMEGYAEGASRIFLRFKLVRPPGE